MNMLIRWVATGIFVVVGSMMIRESIFAREFYTGYMTGDRRGARIPNWLARPLFFVVGILMIVGAILLTYDATYGGAME